MTCSKLAALFFALVLAVAVDVSHPAPLRAQDGADLAGRWTLNAALGTAPREIGFGVDWVSTSSAGNGAGATTSGGGGGGRGRRGGGGGGGYRSGGVASPFSARPESEDDVKRVRELTDEVREPSRHLTIAETPTAFTVTYEGGQSRVFYPDGKDHLIQLADVPVSVTARREGSALVVLYQVEEGRQLRYTYSRVGSPAQLVVDVQFIEHGGGDQVRRVYQPTSANETLPTATAPSSTAPTASRASASSASPATASPAGQAPSAGQPPPAAQTSPAAPGTSQTFNQQPDAELKGLTRPGVVVEGFTQQAAACGLSQSAIESAVSKHLSEAGFKVASNSDEDTYVYVNIITASVSNGLCVSRYDVFLYTHTTAKLTYQEVPVLVEVSLLHKGSIAGGPSTAHADAVLKGVLEYVDQFSTRIRDANKPRPAQ